MKKILNIVWNVLEVLIIIYVILIISFMSFSNKYGYSELGKYVLDVDNNQFLVIKKTKDIKTGDLVYYYSIVNEKYRIVYSNLSSINEDKSYTFDNGEKVFSTKIIGKSHRRIPIIGFILNNVKSKVNFFFFVLLPILFVFLYQAYEFILDIYKKRCKKEKKEKKTEEKKTEEKKKVKPKKEVKEKDKKVKRKKTQK